MKNVELRMKNLAVPKGLVILAFMLVATLPGLPMIGKDASKSVQACCMREGWT